jgi:hypothetical protein
VGRVDEGVQEADRDAFDPLVAQRRNQRADGLLVERAQDRAGVVEPLGHRQAQVARHQRLGQGDAEVVLVVAALVAHREHVAEALGGEQGGACARALDHRVGGERGAVDDHAERGGANAGFVQDRPHALQHALLGRGWGRQGLDGVAAAGVFEREVGEGAADVHGEAGGGWRRQRATG